MSFPMQVSIQPELIPFVDQLVTDGIFPSHDAVVTEALLRWRDEQIRFEELKMSFEDSLAELDRGEGTPLDFAEIKRKVREMRAAGIQP
jgi:Arc/MetJ-type ribon-helix-helix transcriptional regulator